VTPRFVTSKIDGDGEAAVKNHPHLRARGGHGCI